MFNCLRGRVDPNKVRSVQEMGDESSDVSHVAIITLLDDTRITVHKSLANKTNRFVELLICDPKDELNMEETYPSINCDDELDEDKLARMENLIDRLCSRVSCF